MSENNSVVQRFTRDEVRKHNTADDLWVIISNRVYDITKFLPHHPGSAEVLLKMGGRDVTLQFLVLNEHSQYAHEIANGYSIGQVVDSDLILYNRLPCRCSVVSKKKRMNLLVPIVASGVVIAGAFLAYRIYHAANH